MHPLREGSLLKVLLGGGGGKCLYVYFRGGKMQSYLEPTLENKLEKIHYFARRQ